MGFADFDTRLAAYAIIVDDSDRVLLTLWNGGASPAWTLPGGEVELDESPEQGALRELVEETGYDVELTGLIGVDVYVIPAAERLGRSDRPLKGVRVIYSARVLGGRLRSEPEPNGSTDEARWIPLAEVPDLPQVSLVNVGLSLWRSIR
jgi:8-oxo-dGTP diphosphatase